ncbi:MAG: lysophospholipase L1-like esterase [Verrucomicrobiales bacterium]|jgi:lysophospholipase L1-like esterase
MKITALSLAAVVACAAFFPSSNTLAAEKVLVIGDSLSREYQVEFPVFPDARNWVELLAENRADDFDFGERRPTRRYEYNWAQPTSSAEDFADLLTGGSFLQEVFQDAINDDFDNVDSVVVFIGGNDIDSKYGPIYNGNQGTADDIIARIENDLEDIIDFVLDDTPNMRMILVNVPHVGATPEVKADHPTDPIKTGRVTTALQTLNDNLRDLAEEKDIGYADVFTFVTELLSDDPYCIGGYPFINEGDDDGDAEYLWLGGDLSQNFHPNTNGQALVANEIIAAYNEKYDLGAEPFSELEIVEDLLGLETPLSEWAEGFGLASNQRQPDDDPDGDGLNNLLEYALDLDPTQPTNLPSPVITGGSFQFEYTVRAHTCYEVIPEISSNLTGWTPVGAGNISELSDNHFLVSVPSSQDAQFLHLRIQQR